MEKVGGDGVKPYDYLAQHQFDWLLPSLSKLGQAPVEQTPITLKRVYVIVRIPTPGEILVETCGCSSRVGESLQTCEEHKSKRLGCP